MLNEYIIFVNLLIILFVYSSVPFKTMHTKDTNAVEKVLDDNHVLQIDPRIVRIFKDLDDKSWTNVEVLTRSFMYYHYNNMGVEKRRVLNRIERVLNKFIFMVPYDLYLRKRVKLGIDNIMYTLNGMNDNVDRTMMAAGSDTYYFS